MENEQTKAENEKKKLTQQVESLNTKIKGLDNTIEQKNKLVKQLVGYKYKKWAQLKFTFYRKTVWQKNEKSFQKPI